jgi:hypothetical protein
MERLEDATEPPWPALREALVGLQESTMEAT